jgi:DNA (cytosine-5)-methyltransferase 1
MTFKYVELFAGIGGVSFGFDKNGGKCVMASEIDKFATQAYNILHPSVDLRGDITSIKEDDVPDHDILSFTTPCQSFSIAGKRLGFEDTRGTLVFEALRIAKHKQPKILFMENVKGLVSHDSGKTLDTIILSMNDIGYTVDFEVLDSSYFGVPQHRERIFIVAIRDDLVTPSPWKIGRSGVVTNGKRRISEIEGIKTFNFDWPKQINKTNLNASDLIKDNYRECSEQQIEAVKNSSYNTRKFNDGKSHSPTLAARDWKDGGRFFIHNDKYVKTDPIVHFRLQGFSDEDFDKLTANGISNTQLYKMAGNAVTVNVIDAIGKRLLPYLGL